MSGISKKVVPALFYVLFEQELSTNKNTNNMKQKVLFAVLALMVFSGAIAQNADQGNRHLFPVKGNGLYGYINAKGTIVIPMQYQWASEFSEGHAVAMKNNTYYCINLQGTERAAQINTDVKIEGEFNDGMVLIRNREDRKYGYMDTTGRIAISPQYDEAGPFSEGLAAVVYYGECFYIDKTGARAIRQVEWLGEKYNIAYAGRFSEGLAAVQVEDNDLYYGYIDKNGKMLIDPVYYIAGEFREGMARVSMSPSGGLGYIDHNGRYAVKPVYVQAYPYVDGVACALDSRYGSPKVVLLGAKGEIISSFDGEIYALQAVPTDGRVVVTYGTDGGGIFLGYSTSGTKEYLFYNLSLKMDKPYPPIAAEAMTGFDHGLARFLSNNRVYYFDTEGAVVFTSEETNLRSYTGNLSSAKAEDNWMISNEWERKSVEIETILDTFVDEEVVIMVDTTLPLPPPPSENDGDGGIEIVPVSIDIDEIDEDEYEYIDAIYDVVEEDPQFPGGVEALYKYLAENIVYPMQAKDNNISGRVYVSFVVEKDGSISDPKVLRNIGAGCGEEAVRVVRNMPRWTPGKNRGKPVRTRYNLPVNFTPPDPGVIV